MKQNLIHIALAVVAFALNCHPATALPEGEKTMQSERRVYKNAQEIIEVIREGKSPNSDGDTFKSLPNLMYGKRPDPRAMEALGKELATGTLDVRVRIIDLLDNIRRFTDPGHELRTPEVIALLVGPALAKADSARDRAMEMLCTYASSATLSRYGDAFTNVLKEPTRRGLLLIAKAKPPQAREEVIRLSRLPEWNEPNDLGSTAMRIARAAFGDTKIEDEYLDEMVRNEKAGGGGWHMFEPLAQIGTRRSLQAVCLRMRSPYILDSFPVMATSVRLMAMKALWYAFPERPELSPSDVRTDEDYIKAEQFCTQELGVNFEGVPRPEFFTRMGYPWPHEGSRMETP